MSPVNKDKNIGKNRMLFLNILFSYRFSETHKQIETLLILKK